MVRAWQCLPWVLCALAWCAPTERAEHKAPGPRALSLDWVFGDHMVLQRDREIVVSGTAPAGVAVSVRFGELQATGPSDEGGRFELRLSPCAASWVPRELTVTCDGLEQHIEDVLVGDVWLLAGAVGIEEASTSRLRICRRQGAWTLERRVLSDEELARISSMQFESSPWLPPAPSAAPTTEPWIAFGETLSAELDVPIGLIDASQANSSLEGWLDLALIASDPQLSSLAEDFLESPLTQISVRGSVRTHLREWSLAGRPAPRPLHFLEPGYLFEAVIQDLAPFGLCGVAWGDDGQKTHDPATADRIVRQLVPAWRAEFENLELRFLWQQLAGSDDPLAQYVREVQTGWRDLGHVEVAACFDLAQAALGLRLAREVLQGASPQLGSPTQREERLELELAHEWQWRSGSEGLGFELASDDLRFFPARAELTEDGLQLTASEVERPVAARYGWSTRPESHLIDATGAALEPLRTHPVEPLKIACIGDSLTFGHGLEDRRSEAYPLRLAQLLGDRFLVRNFSRNATTAAGTRFPGAWNPTFDTTREYKAALAFEPHVVVCNLGTNDLTTWSTSGPDRAQQFEAAYRELIEAFRATSNQPEIWLWSPIAPLYPGHVNHGDEREAELNASLARLVEESGVRAIDLHASCGERPEWFPDQLHPDPAGCLAVAVAVHEAFGEELRGTPVPALRPLRLYLVEEAGGTAPREHAHHPADDQRLVFLPRRESPGCLQLEPLSNSPASLKQGRALWDRGLRNFALLPCDDKAELPELLGQVERELPRPLRYRLESL